MFALTLVVATGCGVAGGVFFAFSSFVMRALGRLPASEGVAAMQSINVVVITPWFMAALFGTAAACIALVVAALMEWDAAYAPFSLAAGVSYLIGTIGLTIAVHVPRNDALAEVDPHGHDAPGRWDRYLAEWTAWNHLRAAAAGLASGLLIGAIHAS